MVIRIGFIIILLFVAFRLVIPYMLSSQSTELVILGLFAFVGIIGFYLYKVEKSFVNGFIKFFKKENNESIKK